MAGEIQLNSTSFASESSGTITINNATIGSAVAMAANQACVKTAINASGSAPIYACRAWVNFNGTGTVAIGDSGNVSSITDNGTGDYTVNFTTAMPNANYAVTQIYKPDSTSSGALTRMLFLNSQSAGSFNVVTRAMGGTPADYPILCFAVFS